MDRIATIDELNSLRQRLAEARERSEKVVSLCAGTGCQAADSLKIAAAFEAALAEAGLSDRVAVRRTGCHGFCEQGPIVVVEPEGFFYCRVCPDDVAEIVETTIRGDRPLHRLLYTDPVSGEKARTREEIAFYGGQQRVLLERNQAVDPESLEDYLACGGYSALAKVLTEMSPTEVIEHIKASGLRGRGGGGFPTGRKWELCRAADGDGRYVVCNADEGDPGAYMDRSLLEGNPHLVLEGMTIGAFAIGAGEGYIYVRDEYPLAWRHSRKAAEAARRAGLLGEDILGTGLNLDIKVARGAGAFVSGESTALMRALEGRVGEPRPKDVHTVQKGLRGKPTNLNNVETWANVPEIIQRGADWFAGMGTEGSKGTKIFALTGQVKNTGLVEVAMGTSLHDIIYGVGGGALDGKAVKAVQTGGPSGGCLPAEKFDLPLDYEALQEAGSMVGSGGMVVMDEGTCMVDVAHYFLGFLQDESCGKCAPCRLGIDRMLEIVTAIKEGRGRPEQLTLLEELGETVAEASLCALGKTAPNPVLSTLRYFRPEYEAHVNEGRCPAGVCRALITFTIDEDACTGCGACLRACPQGAVSGEPGEPHEIDPEACTRCGICRDECGFDAIAVR